MGDGATIGSDRPRARALPVDASPGTTKTKPAAAGAVPAAPPTDGVDARPASLPSNSPDARAIAPPSPDAVGASPRFPQPLPGHVRSVTTGLGAYTPKDPSLRAAAVQVRTLWTTTGDQIRNGRYADALATLQQLDAIGVPKGTLRIGAPAIVAGAPGLDKVEMTDTAIRLQLGFQVAMTEALEANAKPAPNMPPTHAQLKDYFATLKGDPAAALAAYESYCLAYQVHPADAGLGNSISYSDTTFSMAGRNVTVGGPMSWADLAPPRRQVVGAGEHAGKVVNDCEGYVAIASSLLGAAGFEVVSYVVALAEPNKPAHSLLLLRDPSGANVVISNGTFCGPSDDAHRLLTRAWGGLKRPSTPTFYAGTSAAEAMAHAATRTGTTL